MTKPSDAAKCGKYVGDNDGTCPQLSCVRDAGHKGLCDNVRGDDMKPSDASMKRAREIIRLFGDEPPNGPLMLETLAICVNEIRDEALEEAAVAIGKRKMDPELRDVLTWHIRALKVKP